MGARKDLAAAAKRIADALERIAPAPPAPARLGDAAAFLWDAETKRLRAARRVSAPPLRLLRGIDDQKDQLFENTRRFAAGAPANNALLWGARGAGKSALVKSIHGAIEEQSPGALKLIEIQREDIGTLPSLVALISDAPERCLVFCDDLSFEALDTSYKALKSALEGGLEGRPDNMAFYATSNRKHLTPRLMAENADAAAIRRGEAAQETTSLSDRFGLSPGFYPTSQDDFLAMVTGYGEALGLALQGGALEREALAWAAGRGARSGRVAWQFITDVAAREGKPLSF